MCRLTSLFASHYAVLFFEYGMDRWWRIPDIVVRCVNVWFMNCVPRSIIISVGCRTDIYVAIAHSPLMSLKQFDIACECVCEYNDKFECHGVREWSDSVHGLALHRLYSRGNKSRCSNDLIPSRHFLTCDATLDILANILTWIGQLSFDVSMGYRCVRCKIVLSTPECACIHSWFSFIIDHWASVHCRINIWCTDASAGFWTRRLNTSAGMFCSPGKCSMIAS